ncbi:MAG: host attachment protein [Rhizobiaceae bacterium]
MVGSTVVEIRVGNTHNWINSSRTRLFGRKCHWEHRINIGLVDTDQKLVSWFCKNLQNSEQIMKPVRTWIILANAGSARILENNGPGKGFRQIFETTYKNQGEPSFSDQQGRSFNSTTSTRHKLEPNRSEDTALISNIKTIIGMLQESKNNSEFDRLIVCAAPQTLGIIREQMPRSLSREIIAELPKDLLGVPTQSLPKHFESVLAV